MKSRLGVFSNANALLVSFGFTHRDLANVSSVDPSALCIKADDGKSDVFRLMNTTNASAGGAGASFPFIHENENKTVEVLFTISGGDLESIKFNAASIVQNLKTVDAQIRKVVKSMADTAKGIEMLDFGAKVE